MAIESSIANAFDALWAKSSERNWIYGRLGRPNGSGTLYDVPGQPGYKYVMKGSEGTEGLVTAIDRIGVAAVANQRVKMRREYGHLVIREAEQLTGGSGSGSNTLAGLFDVTLTSLADGNMLQYSAGSSKWINVVPAGGAGASNLNALTDVTLSSLANRNYLIYDSGSSQWINAVPSHGDLSGITPDQHHPRVHDIITGDAIYGPAHTIVGSALQVVGATATNTLGLITPSSNPGAAGAILRTDPSGAIALGGGMFAVAPSSHLVTMDGTLFVADTLANTVSIGGPLTLAGDLHFTGGDHVIDASNSLKLAPATDLQLDPGGVIAYANGQESRTNTFNDNVAGIEGFRLFDSNAPANAMQLTISGLKADNIFARKFTADEERVTRGEMFLTYSFGIVETAFVVPALAGTVDVWFEEAPQLPNFKLFLPNHWLLFRIIDIPNGTPAVTAWFQVVGVGTTDYVTRQDQTPTGTFPSHLARQQWRLKLMNGATGVVSIQKGETAADFGLPSSGAGDPGQGIITLSALNTNNNNPEGSNGPFIEVQTFDHVTSNLPRFLNRTRMGNLNGTVDYTATAWGFAAGDNLGVLPSAGFSGVTIDALQGTRLFNTDLTLYQSSIKVLELTRAHGLAMRYDTALFNDPVRYIGWFDDLATVTAQPHVGLAANTDVVGTQLWRRLGLHSFATDGSETSVDIFSSGHSGAADMLLLSQAAQSDNSLNSRIQLNANQTTINNALIVGGFALDTVAKPFNASLLTVHQENSFTDYRAGMVVLQDGFGDAVLHWRRRAFSVGGAFVSEQWYSAGIDETDNNKFKISADESLGNNDFFVYDPATGLVTISGLTGGGGGSGTVDIAAGFGIDVTIITGGVRQISVDGDVAKSATSIFTDSGSGLTGGGDLTVSRHLSVLVPGTGGLQLTAAGIIVNDSLAGAGLSMAAGKIMSVAATLAGAGLGLTSGVMAVNVGPGLTIVTDAVQVNLATSSGLNTTAGLAVDATLAGAGLAISAAKVMSVNTAAGIVIVGDALQIDPLLAGAGLGLTSGVMNVNVGPGISIVTDAAQIALAANSGLNLTGGLLAVDATLAGAGLAISAAKVMSVNATKGVTIGSGADADNVIVDTAYNFTGASVWTGTHQFNADPQLNSNLDFIQATPTAITSISSLSITTSGGDLTLDPAGLILIPNAQEMKTPSHTDAVTGITGMRFWDRGSNYRQLTIGAMKMDELYARAFTADSVRLDRGEEFWSKSYGVVETDFVLPAINANVAGNVWFEDAPGLGAIPIFKAGDYILIRTIDWTTGLSVVKVWLQVVDGDAGGTNDWVSHDPTNYRQQWILKRLSGGTTGQVIKKGITVLDAGVLGQGQIYLSALAQDGGPFIEIGSMTSVASGVPQFSYYTRMGNLKGTVDYGGVDTYGFATGNNIGTAPSGGFSGMTSDATGMRLFNTPLEIYEGVNKVIKLDKVIGLAFEYNNLSSSSANITWYDNLGDVAGAAPTGSVLAQIYVGKLIASTYQQGLYIVAGSIDMTAGAMDMTLANSGLHISGTSGIEVVTVLPGGNVGIGTTAPSAELDVRGPSVASMQLSTTTDSSASYAEITTFTNGADVILYHRADDTLVTTTRYGVAIGGMAELLGLGASLNGLLIGNIPAAPIIFGTNNVERMRILATGAVGIGTTTPQTRFQVGGGSSVPINSTFDGIFVDIGAAANQISVRQSNGVEMGMFAHSSLNGYLGTWSNHPLVLRTNNLDRITVDTNGNVGIGGTPGSVLDVRAAGAAQFVISTTTDTASSVAQMVASTNGADVLIYLMAHDTLYSGNRYGTPMAGTAEFLATGTGVTAFLIGAIPAVPVIFGTNNAERMRIDSAGKVGIGNNAPATNLHIGLAFTSQQPYSGIYVAPNTTQAVVNVRNSGGVEGGLLAFSNGTVYMGAWTNNPLFLRTNNLDRMTLDTSGNVGIGTTSPGSQLDVAGVIRTTGSGGAPTTGSGVQIYYNSASSFGSIAAFTQPSTYQELRIDGNILKLNASSNNQVGVATPSPIGQLGVETTSTLAGPRPGISSSMYSDNFGAFTGQAHIVARSARGTKGGTLTGTLASDNIFALEAYGSTSANAFMTVPSFAMYARATQAYNSGQTNGGAALDIYLRDNSTAGNPAGPVLTIDQAGNATLRRNLTINTAGAANTGQIIMTNPANSSNASTLAIDNATNAIVKPTSSRRYKKDMRAMPEEYGLEFVMKLMPTLYRYKVEDDRDQIGLIAEEVLEAGGAPFVGFDAGGRPDGLRYDLLTAPLIATVQQQQGRIIELERRLAELERKLAA